MLSVECTQKNGAPKTYVWTNEYENSHNFTSPLTETVESLILTMVQLKYMKHKGQYLN